MSKFVCFIVIVTLGNSRRRIAKATARAFSKSENGASTGLYSVKAIMQDGVRVTCCFFMLEFKSQEFPNSPKICVYLRGRYCMKCWS